MSRSNELTPWKGAASWTTADAAHLLRRAGFGATGEEIRAAHKKGLAATVDSLLTPQPERADFQTAETALRRAAMDAGNIQHLKAWWIYRMRHSANPLVEKMSLLWHNHFATSNAKVKSVPAMAAQHDLIRQQAIGNFRPLLHGMAKDVAMLVWLDSNANRKRAANENFAREIMELFSLGVGNYSEYDIQQAAKAFTGWHVREGEFWFERHQHDEGQKTVFGRTGKFDGGEVVDLCLDHPACARFIALKLLRTFVVHHPSKDLLDRVAASIRRHDYAMKPVLAELLASEAFFAPAHRAAIIKSPLEFAVGTFRTLKILPKTDATLRLLAELGQDVFEPATVKGWEGGRLWISASSLLHRTQFAADLFFGDRFGTPPDVAKALNGDGRERDRVEDRLADLLLARPLDPAAKKAVSEYYAKASGTEEAKLRSVAHLLLTSPEYQLV